MTKYIWMPGDFCVFKGIEFIYQKPKKIDLKKIVQISLEVEAKPENIRPTVERIEKQIKKYFEKCRDEFIIAVSEVVQNAILHGPKPAKKRKIGINILYVPKNILCVGVTDNLGPLEIRKLKFDVVDEKGRLNLTDCSRGCAIVAYYCLLFLYHHDKKSNFKEIMVAIKPE